MFDGSSSSSGFGTVVVVGFAVLFLKPHDLYSMSRTAGRLCGAAVHNLRGIRKVVKETVAAESPPPEFAGMRDTVLSSFRKLETITRTVSREVAETSPVAGLRAATTFKPKPRADTTATAAIPSENLATSSSPRKLVSVSSPNGTGDSGAHIISRVIEEGAFAQQQAKILGNQSVDELNNDNVDK